MIDIVNALSELISSLGFSAQDLVAAIESPLFRALALIFALALFSFQILRISLFEVLAWILNMISAAVRRLWGLKTIYLITDADESNITTYTLCERMRKELEKSRVKKIRVKALQTGDDLMSVPMIRSFTQAFVILTTDVTTLSNDRKRRQFIQWRLARFCRSGGILTVSHDAIYRRTRNATLQSLAGCQLKSFQAVTSPVKYKKIEDGPRRCSNAALLESLPNEAILEDREVVLGDWVAGVEFIYAWDSDFAVPLLTRRQIAKGSLFWINSGDTNADGPPPSLVASDSALTHIVSRICLEDRLSEIGAS